MALTEVVIDTDSKICHFEMFKPLDASRALVVQVIQTVFLTQKGLENLFTLPGIADRN